jgi:hypothetical protein
MARLNLALTRQTPPDAAAVDNSVCNAAGEDKNMELVRLTQDRANPSKWFARFKVAPQQFKNIYVTGAATREEALQSLQANETEIVTHETLTLRFDPAPVEDILAEKPLDEEPKPGRWDRFKYWMVYG